MTSQQKDDRGRVWAARRDRSYLSPMDHLWSTLDPNDPYRQPLFGDQYPWLAESLGAPEVTETTLWESPDATLSLVDETGLLFDLDDLPEEDALDPTSFPETLEDLPPPPIVEKVHLSDPPPAPERLGDGLDPTSFPETLEDLPPPPPIAEEVHLPDPPPAPERLGDGMFAVCYSPRRRLIYYRYRRRSRAAFVQGLRRLEDEDPDLVRICVRERVLNVEEMGHRLRSLVHARVLTIGNSSHQRRVYQLRPGMSLDWVSDLIRRRLTGGVEME